MLSSTFKNTILKRSQATFTKPVTVSLIEGDGIGVEITASVKKIFAKAGVPIKWEDCDVGPVIKNNNTAIPDDAVANIKKNKVALKGPLATPIGKGHRSLNLTLRQTFGLYANLRPALSIQGYDFLYKDIDFVVIRENTEGEYFGVEHEVNADNVVSIKLITKDACERVIKFAVDQAVKTNRKKVVVVHQSTVQPKTDGLFKEVGESLVNYNKDIEFEFELLESYIYRSVKDPKIYHDAVVVAPNLYGDIITDLNSGLAVGSLGMTPSANIGTEVSIFEAVHGSAPDIAGKDLANPSAMLFAGCMLLEHVGLGEYSDKIKKAALATIAEGIKTGDLKGKSTNSQYTDAICAKL